MLASEKETENDRWKIRRFIDKLISQIGATIAKFIIIEWR